MNSSLMPLNECEIIFVLHIIFHKHGSDHIKTTFRGDLDHMRSQGQRARLLFAAMLTLTYSMTAPRVETSKINNISLHNSAAFSLFTKQICLLAVTLTYPESTTNPLSTVSTVESLEKVHFHQWGL